MSGLECLQHLDRIFLDYNKHGWNEFSNLHRQNVYALVNLRGEALYSVQTTPGGPGNIFQDPSKTFNALRIRIFDKNGAIVLEIEKPYTFAGKEVEVLNERKKIGSIKREISIAPKLGIYNTAHVQILEIKGRSHSFSFNNTFKVLTKHDEKIGEIKKRFDKFQRESLDDSNNYGVVFPHNLEVNQKALLISALTLLNFAHFER